MEITVTGTVQTIVRNQGVTYPMELATVVHLGGWDIFVKKVRVRNKIIKPNRTTFCYICV